jgi:hypothetical protein
MKFLTTLIAGIVLFYGVSLFSFGGATVYAQGLTGSRPQSFNSGDSYCGGNVNGVATPCSLGQIGGVVRGFLYKVVVPFGTIALFAYLLFVALQTVQAKIENKPDALKEAYKRITQALIGFLILTVAVSGLIYVMISFLGVKTKYIQFLLSAFVDTAYAQTYLENPVASNSAYDFLLAFVRLFIRFFVFPGVVFMWVYTGFSFVAAQGRPDALKKAKSILLISTAATIFIFVVEGFLFALRNTVNQILPGVSTQQVQQTPTPGASCTTSAGAFGVITTEGICAPGGSR